LWWCQRALAAIRQVVNGGYSTFFMKFGHQGRSLTDMTDNAWIEVLSGRTDHQHRAVTVE